MTRTLKDYLGPRDNLQALKEAANGGLTYYYDPKIYSGEDYKEQMANAYEDACFRYRELLEHHFVQLDLLEVERPFMNEEGQWVVLTATTKHYRPCMDYLSTGVIWNTREHAPDFEKTIQSLKGELNSGWIHAGVFDRLAKGRYPELDEIKKELMFWKLRATLVDGFWRHT